MNQELLKKHIKENAVEKVREFQAREDILCEFDEPLIAYVNVEDDIFDALYARKLNDHPKRIYRPGKCIIAHYTPFTKKFIKENGMGPEPTELWIRGFAESLWLTMELNRMITDMLQNQGRLYSRLNTLVDWDWKNCRETWTHKLVAAMGEIAEPGPAGSLIADGKFGGRAGGIITDGLFAEPHAETRGVALEERLDALMKPCLFEGPCSDEMVKCCPGKAISSGGIDRQKCQAYCSTLDRHIPMPEVCGRCFRFGVKK